MARGDFPSAKQDQFVVRFPDGMREKLKDKADKSGRSMNAEIIQILRFALHNDEHNSITIYPSGELFNRLMYDAHLNGEVLEERILNILEDGFSRSDTQSMVDRMGQVLGENIELDEKNQELRQKIKEDFVLYINKINQLNTICGLLLNEEGLKIPARIAKILEYHLHLTDIELETFKDRHWAIDFERRHQSSTTISDETE